MDLKELKMNLGVLTLNYLEEAGFVTDEEEEPEGVIIRTTTEKYNKKYKECMWASSANSEVGRFAMLIHAMMYDAKTAKKMGKPAEVAQVFINKEKAAMILDTILHAYPELLEEAATEENAQNLEDIEDYDIPDSCGDDECAVCGPDVCSVCGDPLEEDIERELADNSEPPKVLASDDIIDAHIHVRQALEDSAKERCEISSIKVGEPYVYLYTAVGAKKKLLITKEELDIVSHTDSAIEKPIIVNEEAAKLLLTSIKKAFPKLT